MSGPPRLARSPGTAARIAPCLLAVLAAAAFAADPAPGADGYLLTAVRGTEVERLPLRYVGVLDDALGPGIDLHLVELLGPVAEQIGVASGMSGSPVYFDDRPFGALSYRLGAIPRRPIAGVTRLEDMERAAIAVAAAATGPRPIATPVHLAGVPPSVRDWLSDELDRFGLVATAAGGGSGGGPSAPLRPGSPVGVELARGDLRIAATGTVTAVDGDRVLAFGHPFLGTGTVEAPLAAAEVVHVLADAAGSQRLARVGEPIGAVTDDRLTAVVGRLGATVAMLPVAVRVRGPGGSAREHVTEVVRGSRLTPVLAAAAVASAIAGDVESESEGTWIARGAIRIEGRPDVPLDLAASSARGGVPALAIGGAIGERVAALLDGGLGEVALRAVDLEVDVGREATAYVLHDLLFDRRPVASGARLSVTAVMIGHDGREVRRDLAVPVPAGIAAGTRLALAVGSPRDLETVSGRPFAARVASANDVEALIEALSEPRGDHRLTAALYRADAGIVTDGARFSELPPSARGLATAGSARRDVVPLRVAPLAAVETTLDGPVAGGLSAAIEVGPATAAREASP